MKLPQIQPNPRATTAFTMVEIAISLAVIAFALVAIIGVLPSGLTVQRENREETIINQDASVFASTIRNGERGFDDLTNYVYAITNWWTTWDLVTNNNTIDTNNPVSWFDGYGQVDSETHSITLPIPGLPLTNGLRIVGLMSRPKYEFPPGQLRSNHIVAYVRAMSGLATEKPPQTNADVRADAFTYRLICENQQTPAYLDPVPLPVGQTDYTRQLMNNLREVRFTFRWPLTTKGQTGNGRQTFRMAVGGELQRTSDPVGHPLFFFRPTTFVKAQP
jgi:type II secretory pathway pseudopilin PulG